ncbi:MAG: AarF/ABC1/UbiB kinase family protein [Chloroflexi bacterium]|nr:AarF/ABC1/UbiB kinase family protein [Chloroflexota bacterium]
MLLRPLTTAYRHVGRYRQVANILARHGFGFVLDQTGLSGLVDWPRRVFRRPVDVREALTAPVRLRLVIEAIGPTAIKLGQMLSTRPDLLPAEIIEALEKLQDTVPPFPFEQSLAVVEEELGAPVDRLFAAFDAAPFAAASLAQVHAARLPDGQEVVVKVQRPGVRRLIETDVSILYNLAGLLERRTDWARSYGLTGIVEEFARTIRDELDFAMEGRSADQIRDNFADDPNVRIPRVYWSHTRRRVITLERLAGTKITDLTGLAAAGLDPKTICRRFLSAVLEQILIDGIFHADPHPGNVLVDPVGRIVFVDFGMIGSLDEELKRQLVDLTLALVRRDVDTVARGLLAVGVLRQSVNLRELKQDIARQIRRYYRVPIRQIPVGEAMNESLRLAYKYRVKMPSDLTFLARATMTAEGVATQLDPTISVVELAEPFARRLLAERASPIRLGQDLAHNVADLGRLASDLPRRLDTILTMLQDGELAIRMQAAEPSGNGSRARGSTTSLALAIVVAAGSVSSALLLQLDRGPQTFGLPAFGVIGFLLASFLGVWLVVDLLRGGR